MFIPLYVGARVPCFASSNFDIAQSPYIGLYPSTSFGRVGWQSYNVPLGRWAFGLQYWCGMSHTMLWNMQRFPYAYHFCPSVRVRNWIIHLVGSMWVAVGTGRQVELPFGGSKQLRPFQGTIPSVKIFHPRIGLHGIYQQLGISTHDNNLQFQGRWIMPLPEYPPFNHNL